MKKWLPTLIILSALSLTACQSSDAVGQGNVTSQNRKTTAFNAINIKGGFAVSVAVSPKTTLSVSAQANLLPYIITTVKNHTLDVFTKPNVHLSTRKPMRITVDTPKLTSVSCKGGTLLTVKHIQGKQFNLSAFGAAQARLSGRVQQATIKMVGAASVYARKLLAENASISLTGAGEALIYASQSLHARVRGIGEIRYFGSPKTIDQAVRGLGTISGS